MKENKMYKRNTKTTDIMNDMFSGKRPIKRSTIAPGQQPYYYYSPDEYNKGIAISERKQFDVPDENSPNPAMTSLPNYSSSTLGGNGTMQVSASQPNSAPGKNWASGATSLDMAGCATNGAAQGATLGWSDEILGVGAGIGKSLDAASNLENPFKAFENAYTNTRDANRDYLKWCQDNYPKTTYGSEFVGAVASPVKFAKVAKTAPLSVKAGASLKNAQRSGAFYGAGSAEGGLANHVWGMGLGAVNGVFNNKAVRSLGQEMLQLPATKQARDLFFDVLENAGPTVSDGGMNYLLNRNRK